MNGNRWARLGQEVVFFVCDAFMKGHSALRIAGEVSARFKEPLHRTQVYQVVAEGRARGYFQLTPPRNEILSQRMTDRFLPAKQPSGAEKTITVVTRGFEVSLEDVAIEGAVKAQKVIH